jgi:hypothetical protein
LQHLMKVTEPIQWNKTQRVIDITRSLKKYFPKEKRPQIVANIGGFSMDAQLPEEQKESLYEQFF